MLRIYLCPSVIVTESKLRNVQRQIFLADFVITAHDAALQETPERFDVVCVDVPGTIHATLSLPCHAETTAQVSDSSHFIGCDQIDFIRNGPGARIATRFEWSYFR